MSVLVVATNATDPGLWDKIQRRAHQRVDYLELTRSANAEYVDYGIVPRNRPLERIEERLRLDVRQALAVARMVRQKGFRRVLSLSERVGIPLAGLLPAHVSHYVIQHHPMSRTKIALETVTGYYRRWKRIIAISSAERAGLQAAFRLDDERVVALTCPVDTEFFSPCEDAPDQGKGQIESLGLSHRDYPTLIKAMRMLPEIPCKFRVGSAWVVRDAGFTKDQLPQNITLEPYVEPDILRKKILENNFLVVVMRNGTQWSAGCTTVSIAQSMGKAVVATDLPGLRDYVRDGETGILVKPSDPQALAEAIQFLWENPDIARRMGKRGREFMVQCFGMEDWLQRIIEIISVD